MATTPGSVRHGRGPGFLIRRLHQVSVSIFHDYLSPLEITPLQNTILLLLNKEDAIEQVTLAARARVDTSTMKDVLTRLETKGLLRREPGTLDRRTRIVFITDAGRDLLQAAVVEARRAAQDLLSPLGQEERKTFLDMIDRVVRAHEAQQTSDTDVPWRRGRVASVE